MDTNKNSSKNHVTKRKPNRRQMETRCNPMDTKCKANRNQMEDPEWNTQGLADPERADGVRLQVVIQGGEVEARRFLHSEENGSAPPLTWARPHFD